jgi:hypothetical protein
MDYGGGGEVSRNRDGPNRDFKNCETSYEAYLT